MGITAISWAAGGPIHKHIEELHVANAGFEEVAGEPALPVAWRTGTWGSPAFSVDAVQKRLGNYSGRIDGAEVMDGRYEQTVAVEPNTRYRLSGYVRTQNVVCESEGGGAAVVAEISDVWPMTSDTVSGTTDDWTWVHVDFDSGSATALILGARLGMYGNMCSGTAWFDDLSFGKVI